LKAYLAGPMRGIPDSNFPAFHEAAATLRAQGWEIVNPAELTPEQDLAMKFYVRSDIFALCECEAIIVLPGFWKSLGARAELAVAEWLDIPAFYYHKGKTYPMRWYKAEEGR
jgi:hypothetical protein